MSTESAERYRITRLLGEGGGGKVYLATDTLLDRPVAIKFPPKDLATNSPAANAFLREARMAAGLVHANICRIYDVGNIGDDFAITMEFVRGRSLADLVRDGGPLHAEEAVRVAVKVADAVCVAHAAGVIHRDLKPHNILVRADGEPVVTDFGIARHFGDDIAIPGRPLGTPGYMPPEQVEGRVADVGPHSDVYALGATLFEALTGSPPFVGPLHLVLIDTVQTPPPRLSDLQPDADAELETIVQRCLQKKVANRYASMGELEEELVAWLLTRQGQRGREKARLRPIQTSALPDSSNRPAAEKRWPSIDEQAAKLAQHPKWSGYRQFFANVRQCGEFLVEHTLLPESVRRLHFDDDAAVEQIPRRLLAAHRDAIEGAGKSTEFAGLTSYQVQKILAGEPLDLLRFSFAGKKLVVEDRIDSNEAFKRYLAHRPVASGAPPRLQIRLLNTRIPAGSEATIARVQRWMDFLRRFRHPAFSMPFDIQIDERGVVVLIEEQTPTLTWRQLNRVSIDLADHEVALDWIRHLVDGMQAADAFVARFHPSIGAAFHGLLEPGTLSTGTSGLPIAWGIGAMALLQSAPHRTIARGGACEKADWSGSDQRNFVAPEVVGVADLGRGSDIFALGRLFDFALDRIEGKAAGSAGDHAFATISNREFTSSVRRRPVVRAFLGACTAKSVDKRLPDWSAFQDGLDRLRVALASD